MSYIIKNLHFIVIHVPIAMLIFSLIFDLLAVVFKKKEWHAAGLLCLVVGTLGAIAAVITGPDDRNPLKQTHELFGEISMIFFIVLTVIRVGLLILRKLELGRNVIYLIASLIGVLLVSYTGHLGGQMVHPDRQGPVREGGNVQQRQPQNNDGPQREQPAPQKNTNARTAQ